VFSGMPKRTAEVMQSDLKAAGIAYRDESGHVCDFYCTRVTYISELVSSGASVKTCQELARHSTPVLTIDLYAKASLRDVKLAVENLPNPSPIPIGQHDEGNGDRRSSHQQRLFPEVSPNRGHNTPSGRCAYLRNG
jgi:hypothetical protein